MIAAALLLAAAGRSAIGVYANWGAFADRAPPRCYAIARPAVAGGAGGYAAVGTWPGGQRATLYLRLSRERTPTAPVTLSIGERRFVLTASVREAFAADGDSNRAIVAAMRSGRSMSVEAVAPGGAPFADTYALAGAATAIDAAALACAGR